MQSDNEGEKRGKCIVWVRAWALSCYDHAMGGLGQDAAGQDQHAVD